MKKTALFRLGLSFFALLSLLCLPRVTRAETPGDLDLDGAVTAGDAARLYRSIQGDRSRWWDLVRLGDLTQNDDLDETDVRVALHLAAGLIPDYVSFAEVVSKGILDESHFDVFSYTGTQRDGWNYKSENVSVTVTKHSKKNLTYYCADIYVRYLGSFSTALSNGRNRGLYQTVPEAARMHQAILAVNGDYFKARKYGPIVRNGDWIRTNMSQVRDICIMTYDGVLTTYGPKELTLEDVTAMNPYQLWIFGPELLDAEGRAMTKFNSRLTDRNPRTAIGYFEPGHYCLVVVDGRQGEYSGGLTMKDLSALFADLGCTAAYNLDGGETSAMATAEELINRPFRDGRVLSDFILIREPGA